MKSSSKKRKERDPLDALYRRRDKALQRVVDVFDNGAAKDPDGEKLNRALDALTLAHVASTFHFVGG